MEQRNFLSHFINEKIFLIDDQEGSSEESSVAEDRILIVTPEQPSEEDQALLNKIFASIGIPVERLNLTEGNYDLNQYSMAFLFGMDHDAMELPLYEKNHLGNSVVVRAHSLGDIGSDNLKKRKLWGLLKTLFST